MNNKDRMDLIITTIAIGIVGALFIGAFAWGLSEITKSFNFLCV